MKKTIYICDICQQTVDCEDLRTITISKQLQEDFDIKTNNIDFCSKCFRNFIEKTRSACSNPIFDNNYGLPRRK